MNQMIRGMTPDRLFGRSSDRRDGSSIEHTLNWSLHTLASLCSQQQFLRKLKSPVFGFNVNKRSSKNKVSLNFFFVSGIRAFYDSFLDLYAILYRYLIQIQESISMLG